MLSKLKNNSITNITSFIYAVKCQNFSEAGRQLGMSASAISKNVAQLEKNLNIRLLRRSTRSLQLTEVGGRVYERYLNVLNLLDEIESEVTDSAEKLSGNICLHLPRVYGGRSIIPRLKHFSQRYPGVNFDIRLSDKPCNLINEGVDVAVQIGTIADSSMIARKIDTEQRITCASPDYIERYGEPMHPDKLHQHQCLIYRSQLTGRLNKWHYHVAQVINEYLPPTHFYIDEGMGLVRAADSGMGIIQLPYNMVARSLTAGRLIEILKPFRPDKTDIWLVYADRRLLQPQVRALIEHLLIDDGE
ncbi:LysR family transcriptional regulator [Pectobacterium cacticida]|uniref:LysR family transcriptional regulator n=1 Tax=Pectobacterium cacticida TaxID=69221 RepID=UPI002FEFA051